MPSKKAPPPIYQLKITLRGAKPPIWRRFGAPANIALDRLHDVVFQHLEILLSKIHNVATLRVADLNGHDFKGRRGGRARRRRRRHLGE